MKSCKYVFQLYGSSKNGYVLTRSLRMPKKIAFLLLAITSIVHIVFGFIYLSADEFMGYHAVALSTGWEELSSDFQILILALIKLSGSAGLIAGSVNLALVIYFYKKSYSSLVWLAPFSAVIFQVCTHYAVYQVYTKTPGSPPLLWVSFGSFVLLVAIVLLVWWAIDEHQTSKGTGQ